MNGPLPAQGELEPAERLRTLLVQWRTRLEMSQEDVARWIGVTERTYGDFERVVTKRHTSKFIDDVVEALKLTPFEERLFRTLKAQLREPAAARASVDGVLDPAWLPVLHASRLPGYVSRTDWDLEWSNEAFKRIWRPEHVPSNTIDSVLLDREVRDLYFPGWADEWALPLLRQLRAALLLYPWEGGLHRLSRQVAKAIETDHDLRGVWEMSHEQEHIYPRPQETRRLKHRELGEIEIKLLMTRSMNDDSGRRWVWIVPTDRDRLADLGIPET